MSTGKTNELNLVNIKSSLPLPLIGQYKKHYQLVLLFLPCLAFFILFNYVPMLGIVIAFKDFGIGKGILGSPWVGFDNFRELFAIKGFVHVLRNTITISLLKILFGFPAPILLAILLNEVRVSQYKRVVQSLTYLPHFFSWVILGGMVLIIFSLNGPINRILQWFHLEPVQFMASTNWFIVVLVVTAIWQSVGWGTIVYLAALSGIDSQMYEAAMIDGAGRWKMTLFITLPALVPTMITMFILGLSGVLNAGFDQIYNLYNPLVYNVSDIIDTYVYRALQNYDFSLGTAAGLFQSAVALTLIVLTNWLARKMSNGEQGIW